MTTKINRSDIPERPDTFTLSFWVVSILLTIFTAGTGIIIAIIWAIHINNKAKKWDRQYGHLNLDRVEIAES